MMNTKARASEQGSARLKFVILMAIFAVAAFAGFQLLPTAYEAYQLKDLMQTQVDTALGVGKPPAWVRDQLLKNAKDYGIPADAVIEPQINDNRMEVRVRFTKPIDFQVFVWNYEFDYTAKSITYISTK